MKKGLQRSVILTLLVILATFPVVAQEGMQEPKLVQYLDASGDEPVHFNFSEGRISTDAEVSFGVWDISFQGPIIQVDGAVQVLEASFDDIQQAPESGYVVDEPESPGIPSGSGQGWFNYDPATHIVSPIDNRTIVVNTAHDTFVKLEIIDYYKPSMDLSGSGSGDIPRFYTFRYLQSEEGSRSF